MSTDLDLSPRTVPCSACEARAGARCSDMPGGQFHPVRVVHANLRRNRILLERTTQLVDRFQDRITALFYRDLSSLLARAEPRAALIELRKQVFRTGMRTTRAEEDEIERLADAMNVASARGAFRLRSTGPMLVGFVYLWPRPP